MARAHDGPMTPLTVGRNCVLGYFAHCNVNYVIAMFLSVECDVSFLYFSLLYLVDG